MRLRFSQLAVALLIFALVSGVVSAQDVSDLSATLTSRTNLRAGPGVEWKILGTYDPGTPIRLDGRAPGGSWARGILPDGKIGWVLEGGLSLSPEQVATLRSVWTEDPFNLSAPQGGPASSAPASSAPDQPTVQSSSTSSAAPIEGGLTTVTTNRVNMRANPGQRVITTVDYNVHVVVDGRSAESDWVRAALPDGTRGWVYFTYVSLSPAEISRLPVVDGGAVVAENAPSESQTSAPTAPSVPLVNSAPVRGFNYGGHIAHLSQDTINRMRQAGMTWVKRQVRYSQGQSADSVAGMINEAHANGFRILLGIVGYPGQLNNGGYYADFAAFLGGAAALGADAIEVWNEPNIDREWPAGSISPAAYTELLRQSYNAIKGANPNTLVISGAPAPTGFFGGCSGAGCDDNHFVAGMAAAGAASYMDCLGLHYNEGIVGPNQTSGDPRGNSGYYTRYFWGMVNTYHSAFRGARPLCFTELGYLSPSGFPPLPGGFAWAENVTVAQQAAWLDQAVSLAAGSGRVRLLIIWNVDFTEYGADPMAGYAMIRPDGSCPACDALAR